jgi:GntR family transcriptional repressor for pyruvate dehydrogenase complex
MMDQPENLPENAEKKLRQTTTSRIFTELLNKIESGEWSIGAQIPSERTLIEQFGVSRIALRESLSMLRVLGVLDISHGRSTTVRRINAETIARLFPLMLTLDGIQALEHVFEVRIALESQTAFYAAQKRSAEQLQRIESLAARFSNDFTADTSESIQTDHQFHLEIARATGNPLFAALLDAQSKIVQYAQRESGKLREGSRERAIEGHATIVDAIRNQQPEQARDAMIKHLRAAFH